MEENTGYAAFTLYNSLKLHFTSKSYCYFKYHGKTNVSAVTFLKRKDKYSFYKLSRKYSLDELKDFYVANFLEGDKWVGDMAKDGEEVYKKWQKTQQSLTYNFENDIVYLIKNFTLYNLKFAIRCGGHSYESSSLSEGYIIDVKKFSSITINSEKKQ